MTTLISEEYRALNADLHAKGSYGFGGGKWASDVSDLIVAHDCKTVLDYGCGAGLLRKALGDIVREYDPAIPGKDEEPKPADLVVCTDVLEHIEPERLDDVLTHLRSLTRKRVLLNIAIRPAKKTLADGRNAHLIVESPAWWQNRLAPFFTIEEWDVAQNHEVTAVAAPLYELGAIAVRGALTEEQRFAQVRANIAAVAARVEEVTEPRSEPAIIVCYGPSLAQTWPYIVAEAKEHNAPIITVSGAHDFLVKNGVTPTHHVECDPRAHKVAMLTNPQASTKYLIASCAHPDLIERLKGHDVTLWHLYAGDESLPIIDELEPGQFLIGGGASVGLRAITLSWALGYRKFIIHGMDCSFAEDQHAGHHTGKRQHEIQVRCGERWFKTSRVLVAYAQQFLGGLEAMPGIEVQLHGDGLLQQMCSLSSKELQT